MGGQRVATVPRLACSPQRVTSGEGLPRRRLASPDNMWAWAPQRHRWKPFVADLVVRAGLLSWDPQVASLGRTETF